MDNKYMLSIHPSRLRFENINPLSDNIVFELSGCSKNRVCEISYFVDTFTEDNSIVLYAGPCVGKNNKTIFNMPIHQIINYIKKESIRKKYLLIDNMMEGTTEQEIQLIISLIAHINIEPLNIYFLTGAAGTNTIYKNVIDTYGFNVLEISTWEKQLIQCSTLCNQEYNIGKKNKKILCFNRISKIHRFIIVMLLVKHELNQSSYISYYPYNSWENLITKKQLFANIKYALNDDSFIDELISVFDNTEHVFPLELNIKNDFNKTWIDNDDVYLYNDSYFSLVTESFFYKNDMNIIDGITFLTEKTFKPILMKHPFIIAGSPGCLQHLRKIGYKTFSPYIDETYDSIADNKERLLAIIKECVRLCSFTDEEWTIWQNQIKNVVEYNYNVITTKSNFMIEGNVK